MFHIFVFQKKEVHHSARSLNGHPSVTAGQVHRSCQFLNKTINVKEGALGRQDLKVISNLHQQCESSFNVLFQAEVNES